MENLSHGGNKMFVKGRFVVACADTVYCNGAFICHLSSQAVNNAFIGQFVTSLPLTKQCLVFIQGIVLCRHSETLSVTKKVPEIINLILLHATGMTLTTHRHRAESETG